MVCDTGFPEPDTVTALNPDDETLEAWFMWCGIDTPGGGWRGSTEFNSLLCALVGITETLFRELVLSLSFDDEAVGCVT